MKKIFKTSALFVSCALAFAPAMAQADDFAELRKSEANMTKKEAKETEAGVAPAAILAGGYRAYKIYDRVFSRETLYKQPNKINSQTRQQIRDSYNRHRHQY